MNSLELPQKILNIYRKAIKGKITALELRLENTRLDYEIRTYLTTEKHKLEYQHVSYVKAIESLQRDMNNSEMCDCNST